MRLKEAKLREGLEGKQMGKNDLRPSHPCNRRRHLENDFLRCTANGHYIGNHLLDMLKNILVCKLSLSWEYSGNE